MPPAFGLPPDAEAQKAQNLPQEPVQSLVPGEIGVRRTGDRDQLAAGLEHTQRFFEGVAVQAVEDDVVAGQDLLEVLLFIVDDDIGAEAFDQLDICRARRRGDRRAEVLRQLDGESAHAAGAGMDEDFLPLLQPGFLDQHLPGGEPTRGIEAASSMVRFLGFSATSASFTAMNSANVPTRPSRGRA